jgi:2-C-methyl-D-erythritol 2,4-cyclodiphosphate synthase
MLRVGIGYDVHAFADGRDLVLGGVSIPHERGLAGHSDADVLVHAVADALLGAAREGDIGRLFPDTDPEYAGADSIVLLSRVAELVYSKGLEILDVDCVLVLERPKVASYRDAMRMNLASAMGISVQCVGIKATTTEGLGFEGRGEGVSAQAVTLLGAKQL